MDLHEGSNAHESSLNDTLDSIIQAPIKAIKDVLLGPDGEEAVQLPTVHIFSVASGHLYEKLLSIMILSVRKHTKAPLHFWLIDNFVSPGFRNFLPEFAKKVNFKYSTVTYKWPTKWLHQESEKQRLIWSYKILFLDVLFPLSVPKIIFIDADQIV